MHHHPPHAFRAEHGAAGGYHQHHAGFGDGAALLLPDIPRASPNPSSKSSISGLTAATFAPQPLAAAAPLMQHQHGGVAAPLGVAAPGTMAAAAADGGRFCLPWAAQFENWGDSGMAVTSPLDAETASTDLDDVVSGGDRRRAQAGGATAQRVAGHVDSSAVSKERTGEQKVQRRLAQNREAARKSRLRKKAYIEELESSRSKLAYLEQELQRARQQGMFIASGRSGDHGCSTGGAQAFELEYARWLDEHQRHMGDLRVALAAGMCDGDLRVLVDGAMLHHEEAFRLKGAAARADAFHVLSGMWASPAERFFMWLGGSRPSELLRVLAAAGQGQGQQGQEEEPLAEPQLVALCGLRQSAQQAEDALSQGVEALQQALAETLAAAGAGGGGGGGGGAAGVANYMGQMAAAMAKLATVENFLRQADLLRQQTLRQMVRILTTRQAARALLAAGDYASRLRALSSLWLTRPRD